jgi:uncharacterized protein YggE
MEVQMNKKTYFLTGLLLISLLLSACSSVAAAQSEVPEKGTLSVTGTGKTFISPDIAYIMIGVHTEGTDAAEVVASNNSDTQQVKEILLDYDIRPEDIQTTNFSIWPNQQYDPEGKLQGIVYMVDNSLRVTLRNPDQIGDVLNTVIDAGANRIDNIQFDVEDRSDALSEARKAAIADAEKQAQELAEAAGLTLGEIVSISTSGGGIPYPMYGLGGGGMGAAEASVPVSPGQMVVTVELHAVYDLNP